MKHRFLILFSSLMMLLAVSIMAETKNEDIIIYLESTRQYSETVIADATLAKVSSGIFVESSINYNLSNLEYGGFPKYFLFMKQGDKFIQLNTIPEQIPLTQEFIESIRKDFTLKTDDDALTFQTMLSSFDKNYSPAGFYSESDTWYFVRKDWFGDKQGYIVSCDKDGKVLKIDYSSKIDKEIPDLKGSNETVKLNSEEATKLLLDIFMGSLEKSDKEDSEDSYEFGPPSVKLNAKDSKTIQAMTEQNFKHRFETEAISSPIISKVCSAQIFKATLVIMDSSDETIIESTEMTLVIAKDKKCFHASDLYRLLQSDIFLANINKSFNLKTDAATKDFEAMLDLISPVGDESQKEIIKKDKTIAFIREESFGEKRGYLVLTDEKANIVALDYNEYSEKNLFKLTTKAPGFKADFAFKLHTPTATKLSIAPSESVPVSISFDEKLASAFGAWILTMQDGQNVGMSVNSEGISSPFSDNIPGEYLKPGKNIIEYYLMPPGNDTSKAYGKIALEIEVK